MDDRLKILPALIVCSALLLGLKAVGLWAGVSTGLGAFSLAYAQGAAQERDVQAGTPNDAGEAASAAGEETAAPPPPGTAGLPTKAEVRVLQSLSDRRAALDARAKDLDLQEKLLQATEQRVDAKIAELKKIQTRIETLLADRDEERETQMAKLVKTYETMKAKDAARIFEKLNQDILIPVAARMREQKIAAILADMSPEAAQRLTVQLATRLDLSDDALRGTGEGPGLGG